MLAFFFFLHKVIQALSLGSRLSTNWCVLVGEAEALATSDRSCCGCHGDAWACLAAGTNWALPFIHPFVRPSERVQLLIPIIHVNKYVKIHCCLVNKTQAGSCLASLLATQYPAYRAARGSQATGQQLVQIVKLFLTCTRFPIDHLLSPVKQLMSTTQLALHLWSVTLSPLQLINTEESGRVSSPLLGSQVTIWSVCLSSLNAELNLWVWPAQQALQHLHHWCTCPGVQPNTSLVQKVSPNSGILYLSPVIWIIWGIQSNYQTVC